MLNIANNENFKELTSQKGFTIVDFYSTTCTPCKMLARVLENFSLEYPFINIVKCNISEYPLIGKEHNVEAVPTLLFIQDGEVLNRCVGSLNMDEILQVIRYFYYGDETVQIKDIIE